LHTEIRTTDVKGRLVLPKSFANATVITEEVSDTELRVRRAKVVAEEDLPFAEKLGSSLSDRDRDRFLELLANLPASLRHSRRRLLGTKHVADDLTMNDCAV
jgi:hypothetical protein